jgi:hypothetical protein
VSGIAVSFVPISGLFGLRAAFFTIEITALSFWFFAKPYKSGSDGRFAGMALKSKLGVHVFRERRGAVQVLRADQSLDRRREKS